MDVKSQLKDAQIEHVVEASKGDPKKGRIVIATDTDQAYIGDGTSFKQLMGSGLGDVKTSILSELDFQAVHGSSWVLADGRSIIGSDLNTLTGLTNIPDYRGLFIRGKNNGRADGYEDPAGERTIGDNVMDTTAVNGLSAANAGSHTHTFAIPASPGDEFSSGSGAYDDVDRTSGDYDPAANPVMNAAGDHTHVLSGDADTAPRHGIANYYIKIYK